VRRRTRPLTARPPLYRPPPFYLDRRFLARRLFILTAASSTAYLLAHESFPLFSAYRQNGALFGHIGCFGV
jgi:hypothetical protein